MVNIVNSYCLNSVLLLVTAFLLTACAPRSLVAVVERQTIDPRVESERIGGSRIRMVQPGDTLHAIAFVNRLNVSELAAWNRLADTSILNIGQRIRLTRPLDLAKSIAPRPSAKSFIAKPVASKPLRTNKNTNSRASVADKASSTVFSNKPVTWKWPTQGKLIGYFSASSGNQGIDIQGKIGQNVLAASAGEVVYVGNGLKGYGNLIIIKHSEQFLSAYAHNQKLYVQEGQAVNASHRIASLGKDNMQRDALHFQIRKNGQPVNPLNYLPRR